MAADRFLVPTSILAIVLATVTQPRESIAGVERGNFSSAALGVAKNYVVYLPDGYSSSPKRRYPVVYLVHGLGATEETWVKDAGLIEAADALKFQALVVMPDGDRGFYANGLGEPDYAGCVAKREPVRNASESRESFCVKKGAYEDYILRDLIGHIDRTYRTEAKREGRAISGESAGGFGAFMLAMRHPEVFSSAASHSGLLSILYAGPRPYERGRVEMRSEIPPGKSRLNPEMITILGADIKRWREHDPATLAQMLKPDQLALYLDCGAQDEYGFGDLASHMHEILEGRGIKHAFSIVPGKHDDDLFRKRIKYSLEFHAQHFRDVGVYDVKTLQ